MISFGRNKYYYDINDVIHNLSQKISNVKLDEFSYYFKHYHRKSKFSAAYKPSEFTNTNKFIGSIAGIAFEIYQSKINCNDGLYDYLIDINVVDYIHSFIVGYNCNLGISEIITLDTCINCLDYEECNKYGIIDGLKYFIRMSDIFICFNKNTNLIQRCISIINVELDKLEKDLIDLKIFERNSIPQIYKLLNNYIFSKNICGFV